MTTTWLLVHQSTTAPDEVVISKTIGFFQTREKAEAAIVRLCELRSYQRDRLGFRLYELPVDRLLDRALSDDIVFGPRWLRDPSDQ
ncbi:hypothetical protein [Curtobacterium sp. 9128]|uniref:hypothetical protein n=1 Tax=Curtobacterium sp. 9128 TaxID=1793722 RepID=UPI00119EE813|nr:hypothetical protein [Curtobacterium sp. 9128]